MMYKSFLSTEEQLNNITATYEIKTANSISLINWFYEWSMVFKCTCNVSQLHEEKDTFMLHIKSKLKDFIATNSQVNHLSILSLLFKNVVLQVTKFGEIKKIINYTQLENGWIDLRSEYKNNCKTQKNIDQVLSKVDAIVKNKTRLVGFLSSTSFVTILLKPILLNQKSYPIEQKIALFELLKEFDLPVVKNEIIQNEDAINTIISTAKINTKDFDRNQFVKWLKNEVDIYDLKVILDLDFDMNSIYKNYLLSKSDLFIATGVSGCFSNTIAHTLTKI